MRLSIRLGLILAVTAAAAWPAAQTVGGSIRGRVAVPETSGRLTRPTVADAAPVPVVNRRQSVVYLETAPREAFGELLAGRARMDQRGEQFAPRVLAITVGSTVDFPNSDKTFHNVFSLSRTKTFDLGRFAPGKTGAVRFDRPGIVPVFCDIHSHMSAYILVFSHRFYAVSDADGYYALTNVPAGTYTVQVWNERGTDVPRRVVVTEGATTEADFLIGAGR